MAIPNDSIIQKIFDKDALETISTHIFGETDDLVIINRFALIVQTCCIAKPDLAKGKCSFIYKFLKFVHYKTVFEMFKVFLTPEDKPRFVQQFLFEDKLFDHFLDCIAELPVSFPESPDDIICQKVASLFKLVPLFKGSPSFESVVCSEDSVDKFSREFINPPQIILNAQYAALASVANEESKDFIISRLDTRLFSLLEAETTSFMPYQESIIIILQQLAVASPEFAQRLIDWDIGHKFANFIEKFPRHTILHHTITNFAVATIENPNLARCVLQPLYQLTAKCFEEGQHVEMRAFAWNLQRAIREKTQDFNDLEDTNEELIEKYNALSNVVSNPYGGSLPPQPSDDADELGNLTPEQLMALLRFITGGRR
ncbi:hypothetical protein TRFO_19694 [Tritrichomonas foetus]|uniref:Serine/threonine-protein phosphatase 4 regulatory subunit 3-like central domain-containing protein n=1 Tax=Tritrichomonas foetus TaxID=1144522 RepID=A0A1J4KHP7_9EUKA|nr:hypothetical protein TRFO_19694 [Tritrichomonas foetus]|eukprot:OHT10897.1 hypothetical protein TRFO_19694 [Tritrichomonas foetus]